MDNEWVNRYVYVRLVSRLCRVVGWLINWNSYHYLFIELTGYMANETMKLIWANFRYEMKYNQQCENCEACLLNCGIRLLKCCWWLYVTNNMCDEDFMEVLLMANDRWKQITTKRYFITGNVTNWQRPFKYIIAIFHYENYIVVDNATYVKMRLWLFLSNYSLQLIY